MCLSELFFPLKMHGNGGHPMGHEPCMFLGVLVGVLAVSSLGFQLRAS